MMRKLDFNKMQNSSRYFESDNIEIFDSDSPDINVFGS